MSKRTSFAGLLGTEEKTDETPGTPPVSALLHTIVGNPDNPRDRGEMDLKELIDSFREVGQLQPVLAVSRDVYLRHKPSHAKTIGDALYVTLGGNRRLEAAKHLGWARIDIALRDDLGDGEGGLDEAVIIENIHRKALAPIKEAGFLQVMVERYGSQGKVAKRIGKTQAYVSQRLALLKLEPELQDAVDSGELKVKAARALASAPKDQQHAALRRSKAADEPEETPSTHNPVMGTPAPSSEPAPAAVADPAPESVPPQREGGPTESAATQEQPEREVVLKAAAAKVPLPAYDPEILAALIVDQLKLKDRKRLVSLLLRSIDAEQDAASA